jgi:hypothetical protein
MYNNFNVEDAAKYICVSTSRLYKMSSNREISYCKVGRINVYRQPDLDAYLASTKIHSNAELHSLAQNKLSSYKTNKA